ncbi:hypothetical protein Tco_0216235 [Tanacetum coccineum]
MMCTKMVPEEEDRVEKFIGGLPDNIQGNVIAAEPTRLQDVSLANYFLGRSSYMLAMCKKRVSRVDIIKKKKKKIEQNDNKLSMEWIRLCKIRPKSKKCQSRVNMKNQQ